MPDADANQYVTYPTWKKLVVLSATVDGLQIRQKRLIFHTMRTYAHTTHDTLFPEYGLTAGAFCTWQILSENRRARTRGKGGGGAATESVGC